MIKKIIELSKIFIKDYFQKLDICNKENQKINKRSMFTWLLIITIISISFLSFKIINWLELVGQVELFLKIVFPIMATIFIFQSLLIATSVFFFSKDLEYILPLPIKPIELLIAKFNNLIIIIYIMELLFLVIPLLIYGLIVSNSIIYFLTMILVLIIFPIFLVTVISLIMLCIMQLTKFIKNKDIFQILIVVILSLIVSYSEGYLIKSIFNENILRIEINTNNGMENIQLNSEIFNEKLDKFNSYFIIINPCISLLTNFRLTNIIKQLIKLTCVCIITFLIFIFMGKKVYLKNLLKNIAYINKKKNYKKIINNKYKKESIKKSYIKNEFKKLIKNPTFFTQCIFQYIFILFILLIIINLFIPIILKSFEEQDVISKMGINNFALQSIGMILGIIQIIFTLNNLSISAISREGKNAVIMKYIPVPLYKQFIWKSMPQIIINIIPIMGIAIIIWKSIPKIPLFYYICGIFIAITLNIINSYIMLIIDLKKPNLEWINDTSSIKDNGKKLYQYVNTIIIILLLSYLTQIFEDISIKISLILISIIFIIILFLLKKYIKKNINKLFKKIH